MRRYCLLSAFTLLWFGATAQRDARIAGALQQVATDSLMKTVSELCGVVPVVINGQPETLRTRQYNKPDNELAFAYLRERLRATGAAIDSQTFSASGKNLFGLLRGADTTRLIVVGAHYDNVGIQPVLQGADDNATGVAAVLESARICASQPLSCNVLFVLWDEEEPGATGSKAFFQQPNRYSAKQITGNINLDMLGWDSDNDSLAEVHVRTTGQSQDWGATALDVNATYAIGLRLETILPGNGGTDAASFWDQGIGAIGINESYVSDFNPYWHTGNDTVGNIRPGYFTRLTRLALGTLLSRSLSWAAAVPAVSGKSGITGYPNPVTETFTIQKTGDVAQPLKITVYNESGALVHLASLAPQVKQQTLQLAHLAPGMYQVVGRNANGEIVFATSFQKQ